MKNSQQNPEEKQLMLADWKASGQSISSYCKEHGIAYHSFLYWQKKLSSSSSCKKRNLSNYFLPLLHLYYPPRSFIPTVNVLFFIPL
jgi:transposase-like protein